MVLPPGTDGVPDAPGVVEPPLGPGLVVVVCDGRSRLSLELGPDGRRVVLLSSLELEREGWPCGLRVVRDGNSPLSEDEDSSSIEPVSVVSGCDPTVGAVVGELVGTPPLGVAEVTLGPDGLLVVGRVWCGCSRLSLDLGRDGLSSLELERDGRRVVLLSSLELDGRP